MTALLKKKEPHVLQDTRFIKKSLPFHCTSLRVDLNRVSGNLKKLK